MLNALCYGLEQVRDGDSHRLVPTLLNSYKDDICLVAVSPYAAGMEFGCRSARYLYREYDKNNIMHGAATSHIL